MGTVNVVLYEPEIPQNTGNIMRTCAATNTIVHLIEPLGFSLDQKNIKRAAANYVKFTEYKCYKNWEEFIRINFSNDKNSNTMVFLTRYGKKHLYDFDFHDTDKNYFFVFGKESTGIPKDILKKDLSHCIRLPMTENVRALNLSNVVAIVVYEAFRQQNFPGMSEYEPDASILGFKGKDYLES